MVDGKRVAVAVVCFLPSLFRHMRLLANFFLQSCPSEWDSPCLSALRLKSTRVSSPTLLMSPPSSPASKA